MKRIRSVRIDHRPADRSTWWCGPKAGRRSRSTAATLPSTSRSAPWSRFLATSLHTQILLNDYLFEGQDEFNNMYLVSRSGAIIDNYKKCSCWPLASTSRSRTACPSARPGRHRQHDAGPRDQGPARDCGVIAPQVCYEIIFPGLTRRFACRAPTSSSTPTDDAWFGPTTASWSHLMDGPPRAIENRMPLVRCTNSGTSVIVSAGRRVHHRADAALQGDSPLRRHPSAPHPHLLHRARRPLRHHLRGLDPGTPADQRPPGQKARAIPS